MLRRVFDQCWDGCPGYSFRPPVLADAGCRRPTPKLCNSRTCDPVCRSHYQQARQHPDRPLQHQRARDTPCAQCGRPRHYAKVLCKACYERRRLEGGAV